MNNLLNKFMRKLKAKEMKYLLYFMIIVLIVSSFSFVNFSKNESSNTVKANLSIVGIEQSFKQEYEVPIGANLYYLLSNTGFVSFQSDYSVKCVAQVCNDYLVANYWQIFLGNDYAEMDYLINGSEELVLYYGKRINLINVSVTLNIDSFRDSGMVRVPDNLSLIGLLASYNATFTNNSLNCLFNECGNWTILVNNGSEPMNYLLKAYDEVIISLD